MINIGIDEEESTITFDDENKKHGDGYDPNATRGKMIRLKPEREEMIKSEFDCVVVHEFGDDYHLSEEERIATNKFYEAFKVFKDCKHSYRKLDQYVNAMRECLKCLDMIAEKNGVYDPEKFKKLFFADKIYINGLFFPKFKGREKKSISWNYLADFILSNEPASNINPRKDEEIYSREDLEDMEDDLFDQDELDFILAPETEEELHRQDLFFDRDEQEQDGNTVVFMDLKKSRKMIKKNPEFLYEIKEMKREKRSVENLSKFVYDLTSDDIDAIAEYDRAHGYVSDSDMPEFKGDMTKDSDYNRYLRELEDWERTHIKMDFNGKLKTQEQIDEIELKQILEANGWNIRNLYENKEKEEKMKKIRQKEKKREKKLREKLVEVQERRKRRMGDDYPDEKVSKKKKNKSGGKKKDKKINRLKKENEEAMDDFLLTVADRKDDFKDYKEESLDWKWDSIIGGDD